MGQIAHLLLWTVRAMASFWAFSDMTRASGSHSDSKQKRVTRETTAFIQEDITGAEDMSAGIINNSSPCSLWGDSTTAVSAPRMKWKAWTHPRLHSLTHPLAYTKKSYGYSIGLGEKYDWATFPRGGAVRNIHRLIATSWTSLSSHLRISGFFPYCSSSGIVSRP